MTTSTEDIESLKIRQTQEYPYDYFHKLNEKITLYPRF